MGHILVDFDGTLAHSKRGIDPAVPGGIDGPGEPLWPMVNRVKQWLAEGRDVRIFTARVAPDPVRMKYEPHGRPSWIKAESLRQVHRQIEQEQIIRAWCLKYIGQELPVTYYKDADAEAIFDDKAFRVAKNHGEVMTVGWPADAAGEPAIEFERRRVLVSPVSWI